MARTYIQNLAPLDIQRRNLTNVIYGGFVQAPTAVAAAPTAVVEAVAPAETQAAPLAREDEQVAPAVEVVPLARERTAARKRAYGAQFEPCHPELHTGELKIECASAQCVLSVLSN